MRGYHLNGWVSIKKIQLNLSSINMMMSWLGNTICIITGAHFTNNFSITFQMWWKFHFALIQIQMKWSLQYLVNSVINFPKDVCKPLAMNTWMDEQMFNAYSYVASRLLRGRQLANIRITHYTKLWLTVYTRHCVDTINIWLCLFFLVRCYWASAGKSTPGEYGSIHTLIALWTDNISISQQNIT